MSGASNITLSQRSLDYLGPFNIMWGLDGGLLRMSDKARVYLSSDVGAEAAVGLCIVHPFRAPLTKELFPELTNLVVRVGLGEQAKRVLKGQFILLEENHTWVFVGAPPIEELDSLESAGIRLNEIPSHLGFMDFLDATEAVRSTLAENARVTEVLTASTEALRERTKELEAKQTRLRQEIEEHQEAREELEAALEQLHFMQNTLVQQERLKAVGEMVSGVAHDFNNILTPIAAYGGLLQAELEETGDEKKEYVDYIMTAAEDAGALIERLRRLYRPARTDVEYTSFEVNGLVEDALALAQARWLEDDARNLSRNVVKHLDAHGSMLGIESDVRRALLNLLFNATDATTDGGTITVATWSENDTVYFSVLDDGTGMSPAVLDKCTAPFFTTRGAAGTGLGLPLVFESAVRHGGRVLIESEEHVGTRVSFSLPRSFPLEADRTINVSSSALSARIRMSPKLIPHNEAKRVLPLFDTPDATTNTTGPDAPEQRRDDAVSRPQVGDSSWEDYDPPSVISVPFGCVDRELRPPSPRSESVRPMATTDVIAPRPVHVDLLVVEDDPVIMKALSRVAVKQGHQVRTATDGLQAIELFHERKFDLVICDLDMNGMKGDALVTMLRKQSPTTTLVIYTGNPTSVSDVGRDAADIVVSKPRDPQDVLADSMRIVRHRREKAS